MTTKAAFELNPCSSTPNEKDIKMQEIAPIDILFVNHTETPTQHDNSSLFQPPVLPGNAPTGMGLPSEVGAPYDSEEIRYHPGFELPPLDLEVLNTALENELIAEPTAEEVAAYHFLKYSLGK